ncbi:MAG: hypothetical protein ACKOC8_02735 [Pirellulales bacterium]
MTDSGSLQRSPRVVVLFCHADRQYEPLDEITVRYEVEGIGSEPPRAVEHSVLWFTEGKGEEDLGVHFFERIVDPARLPPAIAAEGFATRLPASPLSYEGVIVKIRWCVRVRFFFAAGRDFVSEHEFTVGQVPPARLPKSGPA